MINNNLFINLQHGFLPRKLCQSNLLSMLIILTNAIEHNLNTDLVYLKFVKAFNLGPHRRLIHELGKYGTSGHLLLWAKDFLSKRKQQIQVTSTLSDWASFISGIPQGKIFA